MRHIFTIGWVIVMFITFIFVVPFVKESGIKVLLSSTGLACIASYAYTIQKSRSIPKRTREDLLAQLRDRVDPSSLCPCCNIIQQEAIHCNVCNSCVADPYAQHSYLVGTCVSSLNRSGFIFFTGSLLVFDLILLMVSVGNFKLEVLPGVSQE